MQLSGLSGTTHPAGVFVLRFSCWCCYLLHMNVLYAQYIVYTRYNVYHDSVNNYYFAIIYNIYYTFSLHIYNHCLVLMLTVLS